MMQENIYAHSDAVTKAINEEIKFGSDITCEILFSRLKDQ